MSSGEAPRPGSGRAAAVAVALVIVLAGAFAWREVLGWSLLGWDSYPMIYAARITDAASFLGTFTEELMDGRYPLGHFWRPVVHFAFALDHAVWGVDPFGYHLSDLIVLLASAVLAAWLAERLVGTGRLPLAALAAGLAFCLHPLHYEVLPVAARRADGLAVLFTLLALHATLWALGRGGPVGDPARGPERHPVRGLAVGVGCALALGSKETGAIALVACGLLAVCLPAPDGATDAAARGRLSRAVRALWPAAAVFALTMALRTAALGGLGGGQDSSLTAGFAHAADYALIFARAILTPDGVFGFSPESAAPAIALGLVAGLALLFGLTGDARVRGTLLFLVLWAALLVPLTGMSALAQGWYAYPYLPVFAVGAGALAGAGQRALAGGRPLMGGAGLAAAAVCALGGAGGTLAFDDASDFRRASELQTEFLARLSRRLAEAPPAAGTRGGALTVKNCPTLLQRVRNTATGETAYFIGPDQALDGAQGIEGGRLIYMLASYSVEAWCDLTQQDGVYRVSLPGLPPSTRASGPGVVEVTLTAPPGFVQ